MIRKIQRLNIVYIILSMRVAPDFDTLIGRDINAKKEDERI